jgi:hypothetical protein
MDGVVQLQKQLVDYSASLFDEVSTTWTMLISEKQENRLILSAFVMLLSSTLSPSLLWLVFYDKFFYVKREFWMSSLTSFSSCKMRATRILWLKLCLCSLRILRGFSMNWEKPCKD